MGKIYDTAPIPGRLHEPLRRALAGEAVPWPEDLGQAELEALIEHGVIPLVYRAAQVPALRDAAIRAAGVEERRLADLREVLAALASRKIDVLILKGSALAYEIYDSPELRPRGDTDLLIARESLESTREALVTLGFNEIPSSGDEHGLRQTVFTRGPHMYDVHWAVANSPVFEGALPFDDLLTRSVALPRISEHARGLSLVDALLLACIHRVAHHHDSERLVWLCDIAFLRDRMTESEHREFWQLAADRRLVGVCARAVELADEWMSRPRRYRAEDYLSPMEVARDEPSRALMNRRITRGRILAANLRALPWPSRARRLWQLAFPPAAFMRRSFGTRNRVALAWLYVYRGARGLARLFRRVT
jgi:Uncharacterised nucleotidyltransferase